MLSILTSHPIQYQVPLWRTITARGLDAQVWFLTNHGLKNALDREFGVQFAWDVELLGGYEHDFLSLHQPVDMSRFRGVRLKEELGSRLKSVRATHLWVEGWRYQAFWQAIKAAKKEGVRIVLRGETNALGRRGVAKRVARQLILRPLLAKVDAFLCIGTQNRRFYEQYGIATNRMFTAPYCVDNDYFVSAAERLRPERARLRLKWGIADDAVVVLFCGKFIEKKHPMHLVEAARLLVPDCPRLHLLFVGGGDQGRQLRENVSVVHDSELGACRSDSIRSGMPRASFTGFLNQSQIPEAYAVADMLVLPSDHGETWGLVVNEAMASGIPAIVSDQVGCAVDLPQVLDPKFVYRFGDIEGLSRAIQHCDKSHFSGDAVRVVAGRCHLMHTVCAIETVLYGQSDALRG
jgi:glycosyltransferase involved in cell wall biosynthesis